MYGFPLSYKCFIIIHLLHLLNEKVVFQILNDATYSAIQQRVLTHTKAHQNNNLFRVFKFHPYIFKESYEIYTKMIYYIHKNLYNHCSY